MPKIPYTEIDNLEQLKILFSQQNIQKIVIKNLSPNDNSKNQLYLGMGFDAAQVFPFDEIIPDKTKSSRPEAKFKAKLDFKWIDATGHIEEAPDSQLILYPKYPEVRFSGFLRGCNFDLTDIMGVKARIENRIFIWGINKNEIIGHVISPDNPLAIHIINEILDENQLLNEYNSLDLSVSSKQLLINKLIEIHHKGWIDGYRLDSSGSRIEYNKPNAGGYTLEAEFGITPNGYSEPDFIDWELKQYTVSKFTKLYKKPLTLMTPEPTGGIYKVDGVKYFMEKYGYPDKSGKENRINFGGVHKFDVQQNLTGLTLKLNGYDIEKNKIVDAYGALQLVDESGNIAAEWSFSSLIKHWNTKHRHAAFIPSMKRVDNEKHQYHYGNIIQLGEYTDFLFFLKAVSTSSIYYDPGIKMENCNTDSPKIKRRSQFRIATTDLENLYKTFDTLNILE